MWIFRKTPERLIRKYWGKSITRSLPIDPIFIAASLGLKVIAHNFNGTSFYKDEEIHYNPLKVSGWEKNFCIAHALGHYCLNDREFHMDDCATDNEAEANQFALKLLIPKVYADGLIQVSKRRSIITLARMFDCPFNILAKQLRAYGYEVW